MALFTTQHVSLVGMASAVPSNVVHNLSYDPIPEKERPLLVRTTGINERHVAEPGVTTADLCEVAANKLLDELAWEKDSVDVLILVTQTPDHLTPATATILQHKLGLPTTCMAFDINLGCSGYPYGLSVMAGLLANTKGRGLLLVGDVSSACVSATDKSAAPIFSDAGSATAMEYNEDAAPMHFNLQTDGKGYEAIIIPDGGYRNPVTTHSLEMENHGLGIDRNKTHLILNGIDIFNFSVREVPPNVRALMEFAKVDDTAIDHYVFHQANLIINNSIAKKLKLDADKVPLSLGEFGNTSSATIPVTIASGIGEPVQQGQKQLLLCGFGVGLSWGSALVTTNNLLCLPIIEV